MEKCPPEILSRIFLLLCTDGGHTAGVLRLVSKHIAAHAEAFRFWSVCINGVDQLKLFLPVITSSGSTGPHVQHLFISDQPGTDVEDGQFRSRTFEWSESDMKLPRWDHGQRPPQAHSDITQWNSHVEESIKYTRLLPLLLAATCSNLKTLTLLVFNFRSTTWLADIAVVSFPALHHLALFFKEWAHILPAQSFQMPMLQSLTLYGGHMAFWWPWINSFMSSSESLQRLTFVWLGIDSLARSQLRALHGQLPENKIVPERRLHDPSSTFESFQTLRWQNLETVPPLPRAMALGTVCIRGVSPSAKPIYDNEYGDRERSEVEWLKCRVKELEEDGVVVALGPSKCPDHMTIRTQWEDQLGIN